MKSYQIDIEDKFFPELKRLLSLLPRDGVRLYQQNGYEIKINSNDIELNDELKAALEEGIKSMDKGESFTSEQVFNEAKAKYPQLKFKDENG